MKKLFILTILIITLSFISTLSASAAFERTKTYGEGQFTDVASDAWYAQSVKDCYEMGLINGSSATTYEPDGLFSVAQAATIAARMHHISGGGNGVIPSAEGAWYKGAVSYCIQNKIFKASDYSYFDRPINRSEMALMMYNALPYDAWTQINDVRAIIDVDIWQNTACDAIYAMYRAGVFTGSDSYGTFNPYAAITRAEVAALVARMADPALRKSFTLTPLSEKPAIDVSAYEYVTTDNGIITFEDRDTRLYGVMNMNGEIIVPPTLSSIESIQDGYIIAQLKENRKYGVLDYSGSIVLPFEFSNIVYLGDGYFAEGRSVYQRGYKISPENCSAFIYSDGKADMHKFFKLDDNGKTGMMDAEGNIIIPTQNALEIKRADGFFVLFPRTGGAVIYDEDGKGVMYEISKDFDVTVSPESKFISVKNKSTGLYAPADKNGIMTECIYEFISLTGKVVCASNAQRFDLFNNSGKIEGLPEGEVHCFDGWIYVMDDTTTRLFDESGNQLATWEKSYKGNRTTAFRDIGDIIAFGDWYPELAYDKKTGESYIAAQSTHQYENGERKFTNSGIRAAEFMDVTHPKVFGEQRVYKGLNGKYGYIDINHERTTMPIYDTPEDAVYYGKNSHDRGFVIQNPYLPVYKVTSMGTLQTLEFGCERLGYETIISEEEGMAYGRLGSTASNGVFTCTINGKDLIIFR